jgi:hypothetical protein
VHGTPRKKSQKNYFDAWVNSRGSNIEKYIIILHGVLCLAASKEDKIIHI